jgi:RimJ/RimL family protein N-acetyltransferase
MAAVTLREVLDADLPVLFEQQNDLQANRMAAFPARDREPFMAHWARILADESNVIRTILFEEQVAGNMVSFVQAGQREVGYWLGREFWGRGIATQALTLFLQVVTVRPLFAYVAEHNLASMRVLEKCGFEICGRQPMAAGGAEEGLAEVILKLEA